MRPQDVFFGPNRSPLVGRLIDLVGVDLASAVVYAMERTFAYLVLATALTPLLFWVLGATSIHAAARILGQRASFRPLFVLFGYAVTLTRTPADLVAAVLGGRGQGFGPQLAQLVGLVSLGWLAVLAWRGVRVHYSVENERAATILGVGALVFYVVPLIVIVGSACAILVAAVVLDYF